MKTYRKNFGISVFSEAKSKYIIRNVCGLFNTKYDPLCHSYCKDFLNNYRLKIKLSKETMGFYETPCTLRTKAVYTYTLYILHSQ